jgi:hypothetical protein
MLPVLMQLHMNLLQASEGCLEGDASGEKTKPNHDTTPPINADKRR